MTDPCQWLRGVVAALILLAAMAGMSGARAASEEWLRVPKDTLDGIGVPVVENAAEDGLPNSYFHELEPAIHTKFGLISADRMQTAVVETAGEVTRSLDFPGDEVVQMRSGSTILIEERSGRVVVARTGDYFIVPAHWRGLWIFHADGDLPAREHAMVSAPDYSPKKPPLNKSSLPRVAPPATVLSAHDIEAMKVKMRPLDFASAKVQPIAAGATVGHVIFSGEPSFFLLASHAASQFQRPLAQCDSVVRVISGSLTLQGGEHHNETFGPEEIVVIKRAFHGSVHLGEGFVGLSVTSSGTGSPPWPAKAVPTTDVCPPL